MWWIDRKKEHCIKSVLVTALPLISCVTLGWSLSSVTQFLHPFNRYIPSHFRMVAVRIRCENYKVHIRLLLSLLTLSSINLLDFSKWSQQWKGTCESKKERVKQEKASSHKHVGLTSCIWALKTAQEDNWKDWIMTWATPCGSEYNAPLRWEYIWVILVNGMNNYTNV